MKLTAERIRVIQAASDKAPGMGLPYVDELLAALAACQESELLAREWALTARRLWGGGGGVHWKSFYAILDGKPRP